MLIHTCLETDTEMPIYPPLVLNETILIIQNTKYLPLSFVCLGNKVGMNLGRGSARARCMLAAVVWNISDISLINQCVLGWGTAGGFCSLSDHTSLMGFYIYIYIFKYIFEYIYKSMHIYSYECQDTNILCYEFQGSLSRLFCVFQDTGELQIVSST